MSDATLATTDTTEEDGLLTKAQWAKLEAHLLEGARSLPGFTLMPGYYLASPESEGIVNADESVCVGCLLGMCALLHLMEEDPERSIEDAFDLAYDRDVRTLGFNHILTVVNEQTDFDTARNVGILLERGFEAAPPYSWEREQDDPAVRIGRRLRKEQATFPEYGEDDED